MFKLSQSATFWWPVEVSLPIDGGKFAKETFDVQFERYTQEKILEMRTQIEAGKVTDAGFVRSVVQGWRGVTDEGAEVPFSVGALEQLLNIPGTAAAIVMAFMEAHAGAARKN